jgi:RNA 2',3'-cyclic 3'-phosphodiesterase
MNKIRTFIAFDIPTEIREHISTFTEKLRKSHADVKWVNAKNIHITLKFLGDVAENLISEVANQVNDSIEAIKPFEIQIIGSGAFPNYKKPRIIWIGAQSPNNLLQSVASSLETNLAQLGFDKEDRPYAPHLTIGRVKSLSGIHDVVNQLQENENYDFGKYLSNEIIVMRSDLKPSGPIYTPLQKINIKP